ncbi:hypothetical protein C6500_09060 [Candidatus Poribacteria bacterium]|nr:MAG: hypothetical protein C6500_09060 [Candidatus Poribacteria bacterium]
MAKNKYIYGTVCKSRSVPNPNTALTENLPETRWKSAQKRSIKKTNFLFFLSFVSLVILTMPTTLWAELISLTVDSGGDNRFRGEVDRLRIIFTVDDEDDEAPYIVEVGPQATPANFVSRGVIEQGVVSADETVNVFWDGTIDGAKLPDGEYTIRVRVDDDETGLTADAILDSSAPRVSGVLANGDSNLPITDGSFISADRLQSIVVTGADDGGADNGAGLDLANPRNTVFLRNAQQAVVQGTLLYRPAQEGGQNQPAQDASLTFTLVDPLDTPSENGTYTLILILIDKAGNVVQSLREFTFDNVDPSFKRASTNRGGLISGAGVSQRLSYVEAVLADNLEDGIDLFNSTILLRGPDGNEIPGAQEEDPGSNKIRLNLLTPLLGRDDSQDGEYTIEVTAVDKAGNPAAPVSVTFFYDNRAPIPVSVRPMGSPEDFTFHPFPDTNYYNLIITGFVVGFEDAGIGVDLADRRQSTQIVFGTPKESGEGVNVLEGQVVTDDDSGTLTYLLNQPIVSRDGTQDGHYLLNLQAADTAGNTKSYDYQIVYDTQRPTLVSTTPASNETVSALSEVEVKLDEKTSGIDFVQDSFRLWKGRATDVLQDPPSEARTVPVNVNSNGMDTVTLTLLKPIALDGSDDGTYTIEVTPTDRAGNTSGAAVREFYLVSQKHEPEIRLATPQTTRINSLMTVVVELIGYVGAGIDFDASTVSVTNSQGVLISQEELEHDEASNLLTWTAAVPVARDGSADGEYIVTATFVDFTERRFTQEFSIVLDTQIPTLVSTVPAANETVSELSQVEVKLSEVTSGIDFLQSTFQLTHGDAEVPVNITSNGTDTVTLALAEPIALDGSDDGAYAIKVSPTDRAGNTGVPVVREFYLVSQKHEPEIRLTMPETTLVNSLPTVAVELIDYVGAGIDFDASTVVVRDPEGDLVPAKEIQRTPATADEGTLLSLTWNTEALVPQDGSADGEYTITATFIDFTGKSWTQQFGFVLDTQVPEIESVHVETSESGSHALSTDSIIMVTENFSQIIVTFQETAVVGEVSTPDTDIDFANTVVALTGPAEATVPINISAQSATQLAVRFVELIEDGSYTLSITPRDIAGNTARGAVRYAFMLDTEAPRITVPTPLIFNQQPVTYIGNALRQFQFAFTVEDVGPADLYLEEQTIEVMNASGVNIPVAVTRDELTNQIFLSLPASFPRDGSVDGEYTAKISLVDKAGNRSDSEYTIVYDSKAPQLGSVMVNTDPPMELVPNRIAEIVESINSITVQFEEAVGINFANTVITLMGPESTNADGESEMPSIPLTLEDDGVSQITASFLDLEQIGAYVLSVTPQDVAGNAAAGPANYRFILEIPLPRVSSVVIGGIETETSSDVIYVNADNMVIGAFLVDPTETGLSFGSEGSSITVTEADGTTVVRGATGSDGENLIVWEPITLTSDGTTDGRYKVYVIPIDKAGRRGSTVYREFIYDTQEPEIIAAGPIDLSQPVSYISQSLMQLNFTIADIGPADLELSDQKVTLRDASGDLVPTQLTNDTANQLFLTLDQPLPLDGSMDGEYTVLVELADKARNLYTIEHLIVYDTQAPTLVSTVPADGALLTEDVTQIQVTLNDEGGSGIDWEEATVTLIDPNGAQIAGELISDGETALTLTTNQLVEDGRYVIRVQAVDRAGNGDAVDFERSFLLSRYLPTIISTEPTTAPVDEAFTNEELERIEVTLETEDENHLSTLRLLSPSTEVVAGQQEREGDRLIYNLIRPLATDGSEDGVYTIEFTPISASGRSGDVQRLSFTHDTQAPEVELDEAIHLVVAQPEVNNNSLTEIHVTLTDETTDETSGIDWENLDEKWLTFERLSPNPAEISGRVSDDGQGNLTFRLTVPLADNGSADGEYRITLNPTDRAGNDDESYEKVFIYDTSPPMIDPSTLLINDAPFLVDINAENYPTAVSTTGGVVIQANIFDTGLGVNLAQSRITVTTPDGSDISGSTQQNGVDTLIFKSGGLTIQGVYRVTVTSIGNDSELLGFAPTDSLTTEFLYETTAPTAAITSDGGETELTDKALPLEGTASDPSGTQRIGQDEISVPASGVWLVEIVGTGPDKQPIDPVAAVDDSDAEQEPWSVWSIDYLPTRSGEYDLDVRVTDNAGNYEIYDIGEYTMSVSLTFRGTTFGWPNPLRLSKRDVAFFSFDVNVPRGETIELTLSIYDWSGDMVLSQTYPDVVSGQRNDQLVKWNLENQAGTPVARGIYVFRLEAINAAGNRANVVGKVLVVE